MSEPVLIDTGPLVMPDGFAEQENVSRIFTLDRRDFTVFRKQDGRSLLLIPDAH